jgi:hypothetical protein
MIKPDEAAVQPVHDAAGPKATGPRATGPTVRPAAARSPDPGQAVQAVQAGHGAGAALIVSALGVVFGDIGTSPLYAFKETLNPAHGVALTPLAVLGLLSLIFWGLIFVVTLKYVVFVLRADHDGEGGILALQALARNAVGEAGTRPWIWRALGGMGLVGAAMFYGDSLITPAISVLSAVEGLEVVAPRLEAYVVPFTMAILVALFAVQRKGTTIVGRVFGPVMLVWFAVLALAGYGMCRSSRRCWARSTRATRCASCSSTGRNRWRCSGRCSWRLPAARRSMPTWGTSAPGPSASPGC